MSPLPLINCTMTRCYISIMREEDGEDTNRKASKQHQYVNLIAEKNQQVIQFKSQVNDAKRKNNEHEKYI